MIIGTSMSFWLDMVNRCSRFHTQVPLAFLAQILIPAKNDWSELIPAHTIAALMPTSTFLV